VPTGWQAVQRRSVQIIHFGAYLVPDDRQIMSTVIWVSLL
jgi:hypothetical protein